MFMVNIGLFLKILFLSKKTFTVVSGNKTERVLFKINKSLIVCGYLDHNLHLFEKRLIVVSMIVV